MAFVVNPVNQIPTAPVPDPANPQNYADNFNAWVTGPAADALAEYVSRYIASMQAQGVSTRVERMGGPVPGSPVATPYYYLVTLTRDGVSTQVNLTQGRAQGGSPEEVADYDITYALKWRAQVSAPPNQLPSPWFEPTSEPGPALTVPMQNISAPGPAVTLQQEQAPPAPDLGTTVSTPPAPPAGTPQKRGFWEWNWYHEQETGRVGPDPFAIGVSDPSALLTKAEWWSLVADWYGATPAPSGGTGGGSGGGTGGNTGGPTPTDTDGPTGAGAITISTGMILAAAAAAALFFFGRK